MRAYGPEELRAPIAATPIAALPRCGVDGWTQPSPHRSTLLFRSSGQLRSAVASRTLGFFSPPPHPSVWLGAYLASGRTAGQGQGTLACVRAARVELTNFGQLSPAVVQRRCSACNLAPQPSPSAGWLGSLSCRGCCQCLLAWWPKGRCHMSSVLHGAGGQEGPQRWGGVGTPAHGATPTESLLPATDAWWGPSRCQATLTW